MADNLINTNNLVEKSLDTSRDEGFANPGQPNADNVGKFEDLVSGQPEATEALQAEAITVNATQQSEAAGMTLGDKVLRGMQGLREHVELKSGLVKKQLEPGEEMSIRDMFQTQMTMTNLMITEDYIGKIVSKSTQTFDTLLRNQ